MDRRQTLLVALAHPDDEVGIAGTIAAQRARGDRVVILWLTAGEMTAAFGDIPKDEVARLRRDQGRRAGEILGAESRFLDFPDTRLVATPEATERVAREIAQIRPDGVITWGDAWHRGMRHPDHQACGKIVRDAITLARIARCAEPHPPYRDPAPVFTLRDVHSPLPAVAVDVEPHLAVVRELAGFYAQGIGFGDPAWLEDRLRRAGDPWGLRYAEVFDAWETEAGAYPHLLPASPAGPPRHPDRADRRSNGAA
jgi:N-acetylglucosamine malate deacetylase 1